MFLYGLFALAATGRSTYQLITETSEAPVAHSLSVVAAVIYLVATAALVIGGRTGWRVAAGAASIELLGVLSVGAITTADPTVFGDETLWSLFGQGYAYVPLVLPVLGLAWLARNRSAATTG